ncbi:sirohydrochlorin chelatase [Kribbella sp. NPDC055071]
MTPDLVAVAHGTADPRGIRTIHQLVRLMARQRPEMKVSLGFVDVNEPALPGLVRRVVADSNKAVLVPLLLSAGYHVHVDVGAELHRHPSQLTAAGALGPDPVLANILTDRLNNLATPTHPAGPANPAALARPARSDRVGGLDRVDHVILAAAGSSDPRALADCTTMAGLLSARIERSVSVGYVSGAGERLSAVLARTRGRVAVATYLLAPGAFADHIRRLAGPHPVTPPIGADSRLASLALRRYDQACSSTEGLGQFSPETRGFPASRPPQPAHFLSSCTA